MKYIFLCACLLLWSPAFSNPNYEATIADARATALDLITKKEASALSVALVAPEGVIWSQAFGLADPLTAQHATDSTLFGIGSVSKIIATIAVMKLVDQGLIELDTPVVTYLPNFSMKSPEYKKITVRMLLNHSAGFPGTDYRNALVRTPYPKYLEQVLDTLSKSRLKTPPGYMSVYCNDCFTLVEALIQARTGKPYEQFVKEELFTPLGMTNSKYATTLFSDNSFARIVKNDALLPQEVLNCSATGGVYSTANDMAKIAQLFLNKGRVGTSALLSSSSVDEMAKDQVKDTFNPIRNDSFAYGLGWDTVTQPGLLAVGLDGWAKGGDTNDYGAIIIVSPKAQLGVVVIGASGFGSEKAKTLAERILLHALVDKQLIKELPTPITLSHAPPAADDAVYPQGVYAMNPLIFNFKQQSSALKASLLTDKGWHPVMALQPQQNGWFIKKDAPAFELKAVEDTPLGVKTQYLVRQNTVGFGHYLENSVFAQKLVEPKKPLSVAWKNRLPKTWLVVNAHVDELLWNGLDPDLRLKRIPNATHLIAVNPPEDNKFHVLDPSKSDTQANMMLVIPQLDGRDLQDLVVVKHKGQEWMRYGSYLHQPLSSVPLLRANKVKELTIGTKGYAKWLGIKSHAFQTQLKINTKGAWLLYDSDFKLQNKGKGESVVDIPASSKLYYLTLFGEPGDGVSVKVETSAKTTANY